MQSVRKEIFSAGRKVFTVWRSRSDLAFIDASVSDIIEISADLFFVRP